MQCSLQCCWEKIVWFTTCDLSVMMTIWRSKDAEKFFTSIEFSKLKYAQHTYTQWMNHELFKCNALRQSMVFEMLDHRQINIWFGDLFYGVSCVCIWMHSTHSHILKLCCNGDDEWPHHHCHCHCYSNYRSLFLSSRFPSKNQVLSLFLL